MLVLSRKVGESVVVPGCDLKVTVLAARGNTIRLGFKAPVATAIYREEVFNRLKHVPDDDAAFTVPYVARLAK